MSLQEEENICYPQNYSSSYSYKIGTSEKADSWKLRLKKGLGVCEGICGSDVVDVTTR